MARTPGRRRSAASHYLVIGVVAITVLALLGVRLTQAGADGELRDLDLLGLVVLVYPAVPALVCPAVGCWYWLRRPASPTGPLLVAVGLCFGLLGTFGVDNALGWLASMIGVRLLRPFEVALLTSYPTGHAGRAGRPLTVVAFVAAGLAIGTTLLLGTSENNPVGWADAPMLAVVVRELTWRVVLPLILTALVVLLVRRYRRFPLRARRSVGLVLLAGIVMAVQDIVLLLTWWLDDVVDGDSLADVLWRSLPFLLPAAVAVTIVIAERRVAHDVSDGQRIVTVDHLAAPARLEAVLAHNLGDPAVSVLFRRGDGWIDSEGRPATMPAPEAGRSVSMVDLDGVVAAAIVHDPALDAHPALVEAAAASAALVLDNERLRALVDAALSQQRGARARLLAAQDRARRLIERDLHDGAQQRLVAMALQARLLEAAVRDQPQLREGCAELRGGIDRTLDDVGALLAGLAPVTLATEGLDGALRELARSTPIPTEVIVEIPCDLAADVAETAWFVLSEAVANATKHAEATSIRVRAEQSEAGIVLEVVDDGKGGVVDDGRVLAGIRQRLANAGGRLEIDSPAGGGTALRSWFPIGVPAP